MALRIKPLLLLVRLELNQTREQQDHIPPLVHDWCSAVGTADFTRELVSCRLFAWVVPTQVMVPSHEINILLLKNRRPLKHRPMQPLTSRTMTNLTRQRLLPTQLIADPPTMAVAFIDGIETLSMTIADSFRLLMNTIRRTKLPLIMLAFDILIPVALVRHFFARSLERWLIVCGWGRHCFCVFLRGGGWYEWKWKGTNLNGWWWF